MNQLNAIVAKYLKKANSPKAKMSHTTRSYYTNAASNLQAFIARGTDAQ
jgi:hypothetical protein